jgi:hypothetical protein
MNYQTSADYMYIDAALKSIWKPFEELVAEIDAFSPRPLADFEDERRKQLEHFKKMNPTLSNKSIEEFVDQQLAIAASEPVQFVNRFSERFMTQYVMVVLLSHSLCEAAINAILAIGLAQIGSETLFSFFEKADIKQKWCIGPKSFFPAYNFPVDTALYETLVRGLEESIDSLRFCQREISFQSPQHYPNVMSRRLITLSNMGTLGFRM